MNILLVSECSKRALTETRRILDQFSERKGSRTWQTPITHAGLDTLRRLLREKTRKNTAVACYWIRGLDRTELLWIVGDRSRFNHDGVVPTNVTARDVLRSASENSWDSIAIIQLLSDFAGLLHDLGKSIDAFQNRLRSKDKDFRKNIVRHEWVSLRLWQAFVGTDTDEQWLKRVCEGELAQFQSWKDRLVRDGLDQNASEDAPFASLKNAEIASVLGWLVVTHHRLPMKPDGKIKNAAELPNILQRVGAAWNEKQLLSAEGLDVRSYWTFSHGLPTETDTWHARAKRIARKILHWRELHPDRPLLNDPFIMHLSRLSLMLGDHYYSSLSGPHSDRVAGSQGYPLWANTIKNENTTTEKNQGLDEHLIGVAQHSASVARFLPFVAEQLPRLSAHRTLRKRSVDKKFAWQDRAVDMVAGLREALCTRGAFIVNVASTGCGKTLANAKIANAMADPNQGMRCSFAMGLRTLTLQTGREFQERLGLGDDHLAIRVGGTASLQLADYQEEEYASTGSESAQTLSDEQDVVLFDDAVEDSHVLRRAFHDPKIKKLVEAPLLVCTIDHLMPATESQRGGKQIAPMLRLMSGDLVLDEPDDLDVQDIPALTRLVHWAGMLGSRVIVSSATLPPAILEGLFAAYAAGRTFFERNCVRHDKHSQLAQVQCLWIDEFKQIERVCEDRQSFMQSQNAFIDRRIQHLAQTQDTPRRRAEVVALEQLNNDEPSSEARFAATFVHQALQLHALHGQTDQLSHKKVSFGLIRMANIGPIVQVAKALMRYHHIPSDTMLHVCVYHSQHPFIVRSTIEKDLDRILKRHNPDAVFHDPNIQKHLASSEATQHLFIVLGSPVTEVGRDHDYDWAIVEPSSMRSLIQLAGRVRRHRPQGVEQPNIAVLEHNFRYLKHPDGLCYTHPGFEQNNPRFKLARKNMRDLVDKDVLYHIDARTRIISPALQCLQPTMYLADLEHARLYDVALPTQTPDAGTPKNLRERARISVPVCKLNASTWWDRPARDVTLTYAIQQLQPFRDDAGIVETRLVLMANDDFTDWKLHQEVAKRNYHDALYVKSESKLNRTKDADIFNARIQPWMQVSYLEVLRNIAEYHQLDARQASLRFGDLRVRDAEEGWEYNSFYGFTLQ